VTNPWVLVGQLNLVLLLVFVADASVAVWRRGDQRRALMAGGSIGFFVLIAATQTTLVFWGFVQFPYMVSPFYLGIVGVMGYELGRDTLRASQLVGELQASEAQLRESEERLRLAAEAAHLGIWIRDLTRNEIWATDSWRALFGFSKSERLDLDGMLSRLHADDRETVEQTLLRAPEGSGSYEIDYRVIRPDGGIRWIASRGKVLLNGDGTPVLVRGVSLDVTERKRSERETQNLRQEIAHVGRVSMMGQLASALAHEINQPLGAILRNAEAAELFMRHASPDLDEVRAILADIIKNDQRAGAVIDKMRALLKRHEIEAVRLDVSELVADVVTLVRSDVLTRRVRLEVHVPSDLCPVRCDRVHLQQVLLNLVLNGMDAVDGVKQEDRRVTVSARPDGAHFIELAVSDAGHGIPADSLAHVFDPFFTTKPDGMGMGLPISRTIVEAHGGRLWAENNHDGGGATFRFTLPIAEEAGT
jgi:PAS domain S-box-containing protein